MSEKKITLAEIAPREGIDKSYAYRILDPAFLAPDIVETILAGNQPADLTTQKILRNTDLPMDWSEQKRKLHII